MKEGKNIKNDTAYKRKLRQRKKCHKGEKEKQTGTEMRGNLKENGGKKERKKKRPGGRG